MAKRKADESETDYIRRKLRRLEKKLKKLPPEPIATAPSQQSPQQMPSPPAISQPDQDKRTTVIEDTSCDVLKDRDPETSKNTNNTEDLLIEEENGLPEEFLLALGTEGEENEEKGAEIRPELASRWTKLMSTGLGKESLEQIIKKYPAPANFCTEAPKVNPEISASLSEISLKRDKRIIQRQNLTLKVMCALGKTLSNVLKGNITSSSIIEHVNDAAKLCCVIFHEDSSSRKFFALAGADQTIKEAVRDAKPDEFLFGKDCVEKIKAAQTIKKTGNQIKIPEPSTNKNPVTKQYQQHQRSRGGHQQAPTTWKYQPHQRDQRWNQHRDRHTYRR